MKKFLVIAVLLLSAQFAANAQYEIQLAVVSSTNPTPFDPFITKDVYFYLTGVPVYPDQFSPDYSIVSIKWEIRGNNGSLHNFWANTTGVAPEDYRTPIFSVTDYARFDPMVTIPADFPLTVTVTEYGSQWDAFTKTYYPCVRRVFTKVF